MSTDPQAIAHPAVDLRDAVPRLVSQKQALRWVTGSCSVTLPSAIDSIDEAGAFTVQAWVRPAAYQDAVIIAEDRNHGAHDWRFEGGVFDDLSLYPATQSGVVSVRIPFNWGVAFFDGPGCTGNAYLAEGEHIEKLDNVETKEVVDAKSMIVIEARETGRGCVALTRSGWSGAGMALDLGRHEIEDVPAEPLFAALIPSGIQVFTFSDAACTQPLETLQGPSCQISNETLVRGIIVARAAKNVAAHETAPAAQSRHGIFTDSIGRGLYVDMVRAASPIAKPYHEFHGHRLRADKWAHIAATYDGGFARFYLNGRAVHADAITTAQPKPPKTGWTVGDGFYGDLAQISVHKGAMDRAVLAANRFVLHRDEPDLIARWALAGQADDTAPEQSGGPDLPFPEETSFWVHATFPSGLADSPTAHIKAAEVQHHASTQSKERLKKAQVNLERAHAQGAVRLSRAHAEAEAKSYLAHVTGVTAVQIYGNVEQPIVGGVAHGKAVEPTQPKFHQFYEETPEVLAYALDPINKVHYSVRSLGYDEDTKTSAYLLATPADNPWNADVLCKFERPVLAIAVDPSGWNAKPIVYAIDDRGAVLAVEIDTLTMSADDTRYKPVKTIRGAMPRGAKGFSVTVNEPAKYLIWCDGYQIWSMNIYDIYRGNSANVIVSHGVSPNPIAIACDDLSGDLYWVDGQMEKVRRWIAAENRVIDLYDAPGAQPGVAVDIFLPSDLKISIPKAPQLDFEAPMPAATQKRVYWVSRHEPQIGAVLISDPGPFAEILSVEENKNSRPSDMVQLINVKRRDYVPGIDAMDLGEDKVFSLWIGPDDTPMAISYHKKYIKGYKHILTLHNFATKESTLIEGAFDLGMSYEIGAAIHAPSGRVTLREGNKVHVRRIPAIGGTAGADLPDDVVLMGNDDLGGDGPFRAMYFHDGVFSEDGRYLAANILWGNKVVLWDTVTGTVIKSVKTFESKHFAIDPTADAPRMLVQEASGVLSLWNMISGEQIAQLPAREEIFGLVYAAAQDAWVISSSINGTVTVLDGANLGTRQVFATARGGRVMSSLAGGQHALIWHHNNEVEVFDIATGRVLSRVRCDGYLSDLAPFGDGRRILTRAFGLMTTAFESLYQLDLYAHPGKTIAAFDGNTSKAEIDPFLLLAPSGFAVQIQMRPSSIFNKPSQIMSIGEARQGQIGLRWTDKHLLEIIIINQNGATVTQTYNAHTTTGRFQGRWANLSLSIDPRGWTTVMIGDAAPLSFQGLRVENGLRTGSVLGWNRIPYGTSGGDFTHFDGDIGIFRLFNRALSFAEMQAFGSFPSAPHADKPPHRNQILTAATDATSYLMSGMSDGSTPAIPIMPLRTDGGLIIHSKLEDAHGAFVDAIAMKQERGRIAHMEMVLAEQNAAARHSRAHEDNEAGLRRAAKMVIAGKAKADGIVAPAQAALDKANIEKEAKVNAAWKKHYEALDAEREKRSKKLDEANAIKTKKTAPAAKRLAEAQKKRDENTVPN